MFTDLWLFDFEQGTFVCGQVLDLTTNFYIALGFKSNGRSEDLTSFFFGDNNFVMNFFLTEKLKSNIEIEISDAHIASEVVFTLSAESQEEVDSWEDARPGFGIIVELYTFKIPHTGHQRAE